MNKSTTLFIFTIFLSWVSCGKDDNNPSGKKQLDSIEYTAFSQKIYYDYNSNGQIIQEEELNSDKTTADVTGNQLIIRSIRQDENRVIADVTFNLNSAGNVESGIGIISYDVAAPYSSTYSFEYNNDGYMTRQTEARINGETWVYNYYWANDDLQRMEWMHNGSLYQTYYFEYNNAKEDKLQIDHNKLFLLTTNSWTGKSSRHLPTRSFQILAPGTAITVDYRFTYDLDNDGYVTSIMLDDVLSTYDDVIKYRYK